MGRSPSSKKWSRSEENANSQLIVGKPTVAALVVAGEAISIMSRPSAQPAHEKTGTFPFPQWRMMASPSRKTLFALYRRTTNSRDHKN